jgi:ABC-type polysaccharide/polyol phosphate export permease
MAVYADLIRYRELFANLFRRDFQAKYRGSVLGILWSLVNPLALMGVYFAVFGLIFNGTTIPHYPLYLLSGLTCWLFFSTSVSGAAHSLIDSADLIRKVRFPRQLIAFSVVATQLVTFAVMLGLLIILSVIFIPATRSTVWIAIPLSVLFVGLVGGVSLVIACANVLFRDIQHILTAALLPWFFVTPILWSFTSVGGHLQGHHKLVDVLRWGNFLAPPIYAIRDSLWLGKAPRAADVIYLAIAAGVALALGAFVFTKVDDRIAVEL